MAYAVTSDVASEFKNVTFDANTPVTDTEVTEFIAQVSNFINAYVAKRYLVDGITLADTPISYSLLKMICIQLVANRVKGILKIRTGNENLDQETRASMPSTSELKKMLEKIVSGDILLQDATLSNVDAGFASYGLANNIERKFDTKKQQW